MAHLSPTSPTSPTNLHRSLSSTSVAASDTTYHSFHDVDVYEPQPSPYLEQDPYNIGPYQSKPSDRPSVEMRRQDSGYASISPRVSASSKNRSRRSSGSSTTARPKTRPSIRRAPKSMPTPYNPRKSISGQPIYRPRSSHQEQLTFFQFPSPEPVEDELCHELDAYPPPPQTTHYWTSDHTRRLEYAAIDAASRGVKGWILRHVVPDCFVPKENRRLRFDDDTGSVRRYRLDLDDEMEKEGGKKGKKMGWLFSR